MKRNKPFVTWRSAKAMSRTVVIERLRYLEHEVKLTAGHSADPDAILPLTNFRNEAFGDLFGGG